jgi:hypothetical protein
MIKQDYKVRTLIDLKTDAPALKFDSETDYAHMLRFADRENVVNVVNWLQRNDLNVYLTAGVVDQNLQGNGRQYGDVDLLVVGTMPQIGAIGEQLYCAINERAREHREIDNLVGTETRLPLDLGQTRFQVTQEYKPLEQTYLSLSPTEIWRIQAVAPLWKHFFSSPIDLVLATHEQVEAGLKEDESPSGRRDINLGDIIDTSPEFISFLEEDRRSEWYDIPTDHKPDTKE